MQASGALEHRLRAPQRFREMVNHRSRHKGRIAREHRAALHLDGFDGRLAADAAARASVEMALQTVEIHFDAGVQLHSDRVAELPRVSVSISVKWNGPMDFA